MFQKILKGVIAALGVILVVLILINKWYVPDYLKNRLYLGKSAQYKGTLYDSYRDPTTTLQNPGRGISFFDDKHTTDAIVGNQNSFVYWNLKNSELLYFLSQSDNASATKDLKGKDALKDFKVYPTNYGEGTGWTYMIGDNYPITAPMNGFRTGLASTSRSRNDNNLWYNYFYLPGNNCTFIIEVDRLGAQFPQVKAYEAGMSKSKNVYELSDPNKSYPADYIFSYGAVMGYTCKYSYVRFYITGADSNSIPSYSDSVTMGTFFDTLQKFHNDTTSEIDPMAVMEEDHKNNKEQDKSSEGKQLQVEWEKKKNKDKAPKRVRKKSIDKSPEDVAAAEPDDSQN